MHIYGGPCVRANEVDGLRACRQNVVSQKKERRVAYVSAYIWNLGRWSSWAYLQGSSGDADIENRLVDTGGGAGRKVRTDGE